MSTVGWIGLGRLGGPCAAALAHHGGHVVHGYDLRGADVAAYDWAGLPPIELADSIAKVVTQVDDVVYVAVQTPHAREYGGETVTPTDAREFEYGYLVQAIRDVCNAALNQAKHVTLVVVSTVLPGTFDRHLRPLLNEYVTPVYHPFLIAMGTVVNDFIDPEMTIFGVDSTGDARHVLDLYREIHGAPTALLSITSAELAKVAYNTFISTKIVFANTLMELCHATGADVDEVTDCLALATDRVVSARYLRAGMGDGGACHPRDNVALSALARRHALSVDYFDFITRAREAQARWLADVVRHWHLLTRLPVIVLGKAYKPEVALVDGSPALLLATYLANVPVTHLDPVVSELDATRLDRVLTTPGVFIVATDHRVFHDLDFQPGSVVIDPFGRVSHRTGVTLVRPGRHAR